MDIDSVADELYALAPEDFTRARTAFEKDAKAAGDRELAAAIRQLGKPNLVAWLANQLVREHEEDVRPLLELGAALREASAVLSGDDLRALGRQQHQVVHALVRQAVAIARATGRKVSADTERGLDDLLHAALADEAVGEQLLSGRMTDTQQRVGFPTGGITLDGGSSARSPSTSSLKRRPTVDRAPVDELAAKRHALELEKAREAEDDARLAAQDAAASATEASTAVDEARAVVDEAALTIERLRAELDEAAKDQADAEDQLTVATNQLAAAERASGDAASRLADATARRERLEHPD